LRDSKGLPGPAPLRHTIPAMVAALALGLVFATVDIAGDVSCPTPADVSSRLAELAAPQPGPNAEHHRARLSTTERGIHVELQSEAGAHIAERELPVNETCADMAAAVAVVIAAWEADLDPHIDARVNLPAPAAPKPSSTVAIAAAPQPAASPMRFDLGLALIAALAGGQVAPGARIGGWLAPGGWRLGLGVAVSGVTARTESVGARVDAARWSRFALAAGPQVRFEAGGMTVDAHAQALAALLRVEGVGLTTTATDSTGQFGTGVGVQVGRPLGNATPWIGADVLFWPGRDRLAIDGLASEGQLPRFELQLALGLSFGRSP